MTCFSCEKEDNGCKCNDRTLFKSECKYFGKHFDE